MTRLPAPSIEAFFVVLVLYSRWWLPQPFEPLPTSATHFVPSTAEPAGPLNSSLHASVHVVCAAATPADPATSGAARGFRQSLSSEWHEVSSRRLKSVVTAVKDNRGERKTAPRAKRARGRD